MVTLAYNNLDELAHTNSQPVTDSELAMLMKQSKQDLRRAAAFSHPSEKMLLARLNKIGLIAKILNIPEHTVVNMLELSAH